MLQAPDDVSPTLLEGAGPEGLWDVLSAQVRDAGYELAVSWSEQSDLELLGTANGITSPRDHTVTIRSGLSDAQRCKTLAHELAHITLGHCDDLTAYAGCGGICEVEAESVAYLVLKMAGADTEAYTLPYVATWAQGDAKKVTQTADRVIKAARQILEAADNSERLVAA